MSQIAKDNPGLPGRLQGNSDLPIGQIQAHVDRYWKGELVSKTRLYPPNGGAPVEVAKYGVMGHVAATMDVIVYDHPVMVALYPTAFTDGRQTYFAAPFAKELIDEELRDGTNPGLFVLLHETGHAAFGHCERRLRDLDDHEAKNIIFDTVLNPRLLTSFPKVKPGSVKEMGLGMTPELIQKFHDMTEERAALLYEKNPEEFEQQSKKTKQQQNGQNQSGQGQGGQSQPGKGQPGKGQPGQGQGVPGQPGAGQPGQGQGGAPGGTSEDGSGDPSGGGQVTDDHFTTPEDLSKKLAEAGLGHVADKLGLPKPGDKAGFDKLREGLQKQAEQIAQRVMKDSAAATAAGVRLPGAHIDSAYLEAVGATLKPKLDWKVELRRALVIGGTKYGLHPDTPDEIRYVTPGVFGMNSSPWIPSLAPSRRSDVKILVLTDTSGSMSSGNLTEVIDEIYGMAKAVSRDQPEILCYWADTAIRGKPLNINARNLRTVFAGTKPTIDVAGRGGTSLHNCLQQLVDLHAREIAQNKIAGIIYFSDLGDNPPQPPEVKGKLPQVVFVTMEGMNNSAFEQGVARFAKVVEINRGQTIKISDDVAPTPREPSMSG